MNPETATEDTMSLAPGASVLYDEPLALHKLRDDLIFYSVPYDKIVAQVCPEANLRKLVKNMVYVGVVASLLTIDMAEVEKAIRKQFAKTVKAANWNLAASRITWKCPVSSGTFSGLVLRPVSLHAHPRETSSPLPSCRMAIPSTSC